MIYKPNIFHIVKKSYQIRLYLKNTDTSKIGVANDVLFLSPIALNKKNFVIQNDKLICKFKIFKPTNKLLAIDIKGIITEKQVLLELKRHFPTVFNPRIVKKINEMDNVKSLRSHIKQSLVNILGEDENASLIDETLKELEKEKSLESSSLSDGDYILSDFEIF